MGKILRRVGLGLLAFLLIAVLIVFVISTNRWNRDYSNFDVSVEDVSVPTDEATIAQGEHIATTRYCGSCHGDDLAGGYLVNEPVLAVIAAPNLTAGKGGIGKSNTDEDWIRALRHGVGHDGRGLVGMPSRIWRQMSDEELGALIAYLKTIPPVDNELPGRRIGPLFRLLLMLGQAPPSEAAVIDHDSPLPSVLPPGISIAYGKHLSQICTACHGANLNGGTIRDLDGELVVALNLTPGGELATWSEVDFIKALRSGEAPGGRQLSEAMPWLYLQSLPALEQGRERTDQ